ncbi:NAD(P)/FAD-dependent oxidoreductase [Rufibacter glacialis]|uniref:NAD(P)/FAD-dependent oxidoreductase n=1 Tax=Rufibacter glacialis TaxID=1259555 RepID=A0A5M8Q4N8_9BACT|nr:FAD/NAD(P)-binding oxidoreductase [Rufibacter glacialis]KAA6430809.1 NAD(P)/FAD-dependent oxidoreductase [Rufibacter glacialis]GGK86879.1 FAD-dependent oxidoreductase [Rufibacter glacialis]
MSHTVIIGNGITGITAAITLRRQSPQEHITIISSETPYPIARTALMYVYMGQLLPQHLDLYENWFWHENKLNLLQAEVVGITPEDKHLSLDNGTTLLYDQLLLATGSTYHRFYLPGLEAKGVQGLYSWQDLGLMEENTKGIQEAVVAGGGLIGVEMAEMLRTRGINVTMLVRDAHYWGNNLPPEEASIIARHLQEQGVTLLLETEMTEVLADDQGHVRAVLTSRGEEVPCQFVGMAIGVRPRVALAQEAGLETKLGILVNDYLETDLPYIYAAGDCAQFRDPSPGQPAVEQLWYTGRMQGETVGMTLSGKRTKYARGIWFNSAKFFEVEYQSYGQVPARHPAGIASLFWQHPSKHQSIRLYFRRHDQAVTGFNLLNTRFRQAVCEKWIKEEATLQEVLPQLGQAAFDAEFHRLPLKELLSVYNQYLQHHALS